MYKTGVVRSFISDKGFGFIEVSKGEKNIFFHISKGKKTKSAENNAVVFLNTKETRVPVVGDTLVYESAEGEKGLFAVSWGFLETVSTDDHKVELLVKKKMVNEMELPVKKKMIIDTGQEAHEGKTQVRHAFRNNKKRSSGSEERCRAQPYNRAKQKNS